MTPDSGTLRRGDESVRLQPKMMDVLIFMAENAGQVISKETLLSQIWNGAIVEEGALPQCIHALRKALGDDARRPSFIETIPRRGYRLIAPVQEVNERADVADALPPASKPLPLAGSLPPAPLRISGRALTMISLSGAVLLLALAAWNSSRPGPHPLASPSSDADLQSDTVGQAAEKLKIAVLREDGVDSPRFPLDILVDELRRELLKYGHFDMLGEIKPISSEDRLGTLQSRQADRAIWLTLQSSEPGGARHQLMVEILNPADPLILDAAETYELTAGGQSQLVPQLSSFVHEQFGYPIDPEPYVPADGAFKAYLAGKSMIGAERQAELDFSEAKAEEAAESLKKAVDIDPNFGLAWAALSRQYSKIYFNGSQTPERRQQARAALENAERLAPTERDTQLARAYFHYHVEGDYRKAHHAFRQMADAGDPEVLFGTGLILRRQGQFAEATEHMERAFVLDNQNDTLAGTLAKTYMGQRRYAEADKWFQYALSINPNLPQLAGDRVMNIMSWRGCPENLNQNCSTHEARDLLTDMLPEIERQGYLSYFEFLLNLYDTTALASDDRKTAYRSILKWLAEIPEEERNDQDLYTFFWRQVWLHRQLGEEEEAQRLIARFRDLLQRKLREEPKNAFHRSYMAMIYAFEGDAESAEAFANQADDLRKQDHYSGIRHQEFRAVTLTLLGRLDAAIDQLEIVRQAHYQYAITPMHLRLEPVWEPLRDHPRFIALLQMSE